MNLSIGVSNGAMQNVLCEDPLVNRIHIAMKAPDKDEYIYWFSLKNNSTDYPCLSTYHWNYSNVLFTNGREELKTGYNTFEIKRKENVVSLVLTFWDRSYILTDTLDQHQLQLILMLEEL